MYKKRTPQRLAHPTLKPSKTPPHPANRVRLIAAESQVRVLCGKRNRQSNAPATLTEEDYLYEVLMQAAMKAIERFGE
jgi:hypothetical protein